MSGPMKPAACHPIAGLDKRLAVQECWTHADVGIEAMARSGSIDCDLLIVGGGMVGLTMGIASAVAGLAVVVVDREAPESQLAEPYDGRSSAIARGSQQVFEGLGIWPLMAAQAQPITDIRVSDGRAGPLGGLGWAASRWRWSCSGARPWWAAPSSYRRSPGWRPKFWRRWSARRLA